MIYLILSEEGYTEIQQVANKADDKLWLNHGLVDDEQVADSLQQGWQVRVFSAAIDVSSEHSIVKAIKYLEKKWPNEDIEVEYLYLDLS